MLFQINQFISGLFASAAAFFIYRATSNVYFGVATWCALSSIYGIGLALVCKLERK